MLSSAPSFAISSSKIAESPSISAPTFRSITWSCKFFCLIIEKRRFLVVISSELPETKLAIFIAKAARSVKILIFGSSGAGILCFESGLSTKKSYTFSNFKLWRYAKSVAEDSRLSKIPNKTCSIPI